MVGPEELERAAFDPRRDAIAEEERETLAEGFGEGGPMADAPPDGPPVLPLASGYGRDAQPVPAHGYQIVPHLRIYYGPDPLPGGEGYGRGGWAFLCSRF